VDFVVRRLEVVIQITLLIECGFGRWQEAVFEMSVLLRRMLLESGSQIIIGTANVVDVERPISR
jgi:hypothetical protein